MIKKRKLPASDISPALPRPDESGLVAWDHNPQAQALRVELQNGVIFVLPYSHFAFAHFTNETDRDTLRISFATHDVRVSGRDLRELAIALQKLTVDWIREAPSRYATLCGKGFIERIEVNEVSQEDPSHG